MDRTGTAARLTHLGTRLRRTGLKGAVAGLAHRAYSRLHVEGLQDQLLPGDAIDYRSLSFDRGPGHSGPARLGWVCAPTGAGSGGHTTLFRMVEAAEKRGHTCVLFLYDAFQGDFRRHEALIRKHWPHLRAEIRDAASGISDVDAAIASSWQSAHALAARGQSPMRRLYFVQDYEPYFYPRGSLYSLAEDTYRFGFRCITLGDMVANIIKSEKL